MLSANGTLPLEVCGLHIFCLACFHLAVFSISGLSWLSPGIEKHQSVCKGPRKVLRAPGESQRFKIILPSFHLVCFVFCLSHFSLIYTVATKVQSGAARAVESTAATTSRPSKSSPIKKPPAGFQERFMESFDKVGTI